MSASRAVSAHLILTFACLLVLVPPAFCGDVQEKAETETRKITAMAADGTARDIIGSTMADMLKVPRMQLVQERREMNLNYGSLFVAHQLNLGGASMSDISGQLKAGKSIFQIGEDLHANWRSIQDAARKLNGKLEDRIYKYFLHPEIGKQHAMTEGYDPEKDLVRADLNTTREEIVTAHQEYVLWRDRATKTSGRKLDPQTESAVSKAAGEFNGAGRPH